MFGYQCPTRNNLKRRGRWRVTQTSSNGHATQRVGQSWGLSIFGDRWFGSARGHSWATRGERKYSRLIKGGEVPSQTPLYSSVDKQRTITSVTPFKSLQNVLPVHWSFSRRQYSLSVNFSHRASYEKMWNTLTGFSLPSSELT